MTRTWVLGLSFVLLGCHTEVDQPRTPSETQPHGELDEPEPELAIADPYLLAGPTRFSPSRIDIGAGEHPPTGALVADYDHCGSCHVEIAEQWRTSSHAIASLNNPIYRTALDRFREHGGEQGPVNSRFCGGCHDLALLLDGDMDSEFVADEPRSHIGIGCVTCHGVESSTADGNGSYVLAAREIPIPELDDEASIERHRAAMGPAREQCSSCHRAFVGVASGHPHHLGGTDEPGPWQDSSYSGSKLRLDTPVDERHCTDCHMPRQQVVADGGPQLDEPAIAEDGTLRSHRFIGGHSWLAAMRGDAQTLARVQEFLRGVASLDIAAVELGGQRKLLGEGVDSQARGRMVVDLVVRNLAVGHKFPGGTRDAQATWIALRVLDRDGKIVAELDEGHGEVHRLRAGVVDGEGKLISAREVERLHAVAFDHTIGPRDAVVVRYAVRLPSEAQGPLRVEARLLHRSRTLELAAETCRESKTARGKAFLRATAKLTGQVLDPCVEPPVTEIASSQLTLGGESSDPRPEHERLWELGMALYHQVQERLPEAREALAAAELALANANLPKPEHDAAQARILAALGAVAARQGRVDEALQLADRVEALRPDHPYPHLLRGRALAKVWRWEQAIPHLERARAASPGSPTLASELALAYGSAGKHREALALAAEALALRPRDATLLRVQALALQALDDPRAEAALDAYFAHREPDDQPHLAATCGELDPACARERVPVHVHEAD